MSEWLMTWDATYLDSATNTQKVMVLEDTTKAGATEQFLDIVKARGTSDELISLIPRVKAAQL